MKVRTVKILRVVISIWTVEVILFSHPLVSEIIIFRIVLIKRVSSWIVDTTD